MPLTANLDQEIIPKGWYDYRNEIARELGISYQVYQRLEHPAKSNPTVKTLTKIARLLGKNLEIRMS